MMMMMSRHTRSCCSWRGSFACCRRPSVAGSMVSMACVVGCLFGLVCAGAGIWTLESGPECRTGVALGGCVVVGSEHFDLYGIV